MTIIELMIGLAIVAIVLFVAVPAFTIFLQNQQIKNAAQTVMQGLNTARAEAIRRNQPVRFQFVSDLTAGCALSTSSLAWVVSLVNPAGNCEATPGDMGTAAQIVEKRSATEGTRNVVVVATGGDTAVFTGLGRLTGAGMTQIDFSNSTGICEHLDATNGTMRCMRVQIAPGGEARMCDPKVAVPTPPAIDPRAC
ncbi:MAG TPA: GspH/FimT family pseudopilin [Burkholderiales bacterium]|nr:GspH/FimT family pseudopilin [Burkholderiales bacterium]